MKKWGKRLGGVLGFLVVCALIFYAWAWWKTDQRLAQVWTIEDVDIPVPFPLTDTELQSLREERRAALPPEPELDADDTAATDTVADETASTENGDPPDEPEVDVLAGVDLDALALERAVARGEHLVNAIYVCAECHGADLSGGVMIDSAVMGTLLGPNLTSGAGGVTAQYTPADWNRTVRHGIGRSSKALAMPSTDFMRMSDRELSDIIAYASSLPPVDNVVEPPSLGPLGTVLIATGALPLSVDLIDHDREHLRFPPEEGPTAEYGEHLAAVCTGCHREDMRGGPIEAGDPDWLPAANLTTLQDWSYDDFVTAMRDLKRPDGSDIRLPMALMAPYAERMTEVELQALWAYLETAEPLPTGE